MKNKIEKVLQFFMKEFKKGTRTKLKFSCYGDKVITYTKVYNNVFMVEVSIIDEDLDFFNKMTISHILEGNPSFLNLRVYKLDEIGSQLISSIN